MKKKKLAQIKGSQRRTLLAILIWKLRVVIHFSQVSNQNIIMVTGEPIAVAQILRYLLYDDIRF